MCTRRRRRTAVLVVLDRVHGEAEKRGSSTDSHTTLPSAFTLRTAEPSAQAATRSCGHACVEAQASPASVRPEPGA